MWPPSALTGQSFRFMQPAPGWIIFLRYVAFYLSLIFLRLTQETKPNQWKYFFPPKSQILWLGMCSVAQPYLALCSPMDCSPPGSSIHGTLQARTLEWDAISYSRGSSWPRDRTRVSWVWKGTHLTWNGTHSPTEGLEDSHKRPGTSARKFNKQGQRIL